MSLKGTSLAGMSMTRERVKEDFYATPYESTRLILEKELIHGKVLEPACGQGHIVKIIKEYYPNIEIKATDLVDRGFGQANIDFLNYDYEEKFDTIITNPPYALALEFAERGLGLLNEGGKLLLFLKIQFLEGKKRKKFFEENPPRYVYVFSERQNPWRNGSEVDENGKSWNSTMCFAWFVWEKGYKGETIIKWL